MVQARGKHFKSPPSEPICCDNARRHIHHVTVTRSVTHVLAFFVDGSVWCSMLCPPPRPLFFLIRPSYLIHDYSKALKMPLFSTFKPTASKWVKAAPDDEVVEDSEPEREEQRRVEKERRKEMRMRKKPPKPSEVIEVSDDSLDDVPAPAQAKLSCNVEPRSVIIISGSLSHVELTFTH